MQVDNTSYLVCYRAIRPTGPDLGLFGMIDQLRIESIRNLPDNEDGQGNDLLCVERREGPEDLVWAV